MPAKNIYHDAVVRALTADGWTITHDPLTISYGGRNLFVDVAAERMAIAAEKGAEKIAVEVSSFLDDSAMRSLERAVGQYNIYRAILGVDDPERSLYLAVPLAVYESVLADQFGQLLLERLELRVLVFNATEEKVARWIS